MQIKLHNIQIDCRMCGLQLDAPDFVVDEPAHRAGGYYLCKTCQSLSFYAKQDSDAYGEGYYGSGNSRVGGIAQLIRVLSSHLRARFITKFLGVGKCLDVGCGDGEFLKTMKVYGWSVKGTELPGPAFERAQKKLPEHIIGTEDFESAAQANSCDLITMWQVFEHLENPRLVLEKCRGLLTDGGVLGLGVPNPDSWQAQWGKGDWLHFDPPRHLHLQSVRTLIAEAEGLGFECVAVRYPWLEFGPIGWVQTVFNKLGYPRDFFFDQLKERWACVSRYERVRWIFIAALLAPLAMIFAFLESMTGRPATYEVYLRRFVSPMNRASQGMR